VAVTRVGSLGVLLSLPLSPGFPRTLERAARNFDVVHVHVPFPLPMFCDWKKVKAHGTRLIIHYHSDVVRPLQKFVLARMGRLERDSMRAADRIIVTSKPLVENSETLLPFRRKCRVVPLWIDLSGVRKPSVPEILDARTRYGIKPTDKVVL